MREIFPVQFTVGHWPSLAARLANTIAIVNFVFGWIIADHTSSQMTAPLYAFMISNLLLMTLLKPGSPSKLVSKNV